MKKDVLIVGAGPVGLTMAAEMARYGLSVRLVEKAPQRTDKSKAVVIWSRTMELMDRMGCTASFIAAGFKATGANITTGDKEIAHVTLGGVDTPHPFALMLPQSETERLMAEHLVTLGIGVERNIELSSFSETPGGITATLRQSDGREEVMLCSWLLGCDGAHSTVRHGLGLEFEGNTLNSDWLLADVHLSGVPTPGEISVIWHADGVLAVFPITAERYRIIVDSGTATGARRPDPTLEEIQSILEKRGPAGMKATEPVWLASFRINERKVSDYRSGRVFLAGDAAHIHSPAGGQGMNTGMQDACNLAWKIALVSRGECAEGPLLDTYSQERSAVGDMVLKAAGRVTAIATLKGGWKQSIRNQIATLVFGLAPVRSAIANAATEIAIGYPHSSLSVQGAFVPGGPQAGQRAPIREGETPVGAGRNPLFGLFAEESAEANELLARYPGLLDPLLRPPFQKGGVWLVRPDGYVSVATRQNDWPRVTRFLKMLTTS